MLKCVFFDRDGIVNEPPPDRWVRRWADFRLMPAFVDVLSTVRRRGYAAVLVSNQRGISLGVMTREAVEEIHRNLANDLKTRFGLDLLDMLYCPHGERECDCRKPQPGMLLEAARRHDIDLAASWMVGDQERDIEAGRRAGCRTILVSVAAAGTKADFKGKDMAELNALLERVL